MCFYVIWVEAEFQCLKKLHSDLYFFPVAACSEFLWLCFCSPKALFKKGQCLSFSSFYSVTKSVSLFPMERLHRSLRLPKHFSSRWHNPHCTQGINQRRRKRCVGLGLELGIPISHWGQFLLSLPIFSSARASFWSPAHPKGASLGVHCNGPGASPSLERHLSTKKPVFGGFVLESDFSGRTVIYIHMLI